jgi:hypothetical protein
MSRRSWSSEFLSRALRPGTALAVLLAFAGALALPVAVHGQPPPLGPGKRWKAQGPGPAVGGQSENAAPGDAISGAIHTALAHPTNPKILYVGSVNGGVWKTTNAHQASPHWRALTDGMASSAIGALEYDYADASHNTIWAGVGRFSSFGRLGGNRIGLYKSTDAGETWTLVNGGGILNGKNISGIAARGNTIVISVDLADVFTFGNIGIWRSTDGGATFTQIAVGNGAAFGLPGGVTHDLVGDRANPTRLFTAPTQSAGVGGIPGVYRSMDTGGTWAKVSNAAMDALLGGVVTNVEFAVQGDSVFCAIARSGRLAGLFRSGDGGTTWTAMDLPRTGPNNVGIHPGAQASIHLSIVADPTDPDIVYIGGDRQPFRPEEGLPTPPNQFPNAIGAENFSGRLFRCDAGLAAGSQCTPLTHVGTANNSSPHADSREMVFDAAGNIIETDDGGVYRRSSPRSASGRWTNLNGTIQVSEQHDASYDTLADVVFVGTQDNDDPHQDHPNASDWFVLLSGDGGDTAVDNVTLGPHQSTRYDSAQGLQAFVRTFWDNPNRLLGFVFPPLTPIGGSPALSGQFVTPVEVNAIEPHRLAIGAANGVYESLDQGDTIQRISTVVAAGSGLDAISYGGVGNPDLIVVGSGTGVFIRTGPHPAPLAPVAAFPAVAGETVRDIVIDPDDADTIYVTTLSRVIRTTDGGATWTVITGNINSFAPIALRAIAYAARASEDDPSLTNDALVVSSFNGVYIAYESDGFAVWHPLDQDLPEVPIMDLHWDPENRVMIAGTLGRGAWKMSFNENEE